jgi:hypothetical protein
VVPASLTGREPESPSRVGVPRAGPAEVDERGEILLLPERGRPDAPALQRARDAAIEVRGGQLDGVAREDADVEAVEPARADVVPGAGLDDPMVVDAIAPGLLKGPVGDLKHPDRARCRLVERQGIPRELPAPVRARQGVARALDLGQRGEQVGRDHGGGVLAKERAVLPPGLGRGLRQRAAHREEELGRLARHLVHPVHCPPHRQDDHRRHEESDQQRGDEQEDERAAPERGGPARGPHSRAARMGPPGQGSGGRDRGGHDPSTVSG